MNKPSKVTVRVVGDTVLVRTCVDERIDTFIHRNWLLENLERVIKDSDSMAGSLPGDECDAWRKENDRLREVLKELGL